MSGKRTYPDFQDQVALGKVPGFEIFRKFGMNDAVASGTEEMWPLGTVRTLPTSAAVASTVSDSADDDGDPTTNTGAWTVTIEGLDANYLEVSETITMNGISAVTTTQTFIRINRAYVVTAGSNGINVGNITISVGGNAQAYIEASEGQTHQTGYCVPANKWLLIKQYKMRVGRMSGSTDLHILGQIRLGAGENDESWRSVSDVYLWNGGSHDNDDGATLIPPKTDIRQLIVSDTTTQCNAIIAGYLIKTDTASKM